ncbi:MAG: flagellar hook-basal body protein [Lachnospiraceae bacterium]
MYQGFYNLTSGMLTQSRNLNVISNNMVNVQTAGYKHDTMVTSTFAEEMLYRTGKQNKVGATPLATTSKIKMADRTYVNHDQGSFEMTDGIFDFALEGKGFFCVQTPNGERYTRNGAFAASEDGYLILPGVGQVLSTENQPIKLDDENFTVDQNGNLSAVISTVSEGEGEQRERKQYGTLKVVDFADYEQLQKEDGGMFRTNQQPLAPAGGVNVPVLWKMLEKSNVDMVQEMTTMMSSQRALQSAAQVLKMYDQMISKSVSDVGRL